MENTGMENEEIGRNIDMSVHDRRFLQGDIHYGTLSALGDFFGREMPLHCHEGAVQLHYLEDGYVRLYIDDRVWQSGGPALFLTPPGMLHGFAYHPESNGHVLTARQNLIQPLLESEFGPSAERKLTAPLLIGPQAKTPAAVEPVAAMFALLAREYGEERAGRELALSGLARLIFLEVLRLAPEPPASVAVRQEDVRLFHAFGELIEAHFREQWLIARYAGTLAITEGRLADICKRMTGHSPKRILAERMMREARQRLLYSNATVSEIAYALGFKDPAYFCRVFTEAAGLPPSQFRSQRGSEDYR
ncbi:MAG: 4-hydroxyphenylacetate catabolism regulatory protein HpaA [Alphaproteobacteria bacterium]|nr:4-hydroxyphenylacetate catabolism regulatory protein HpaA [Alphaproteobacteria bacterium]MDE2013545.1 4-hydroxyphenylacetate catabolism regulatory protein HpaA [Alphaproteobacteria bacterium]